MRYAVGLLLLALGCLAYAQTSTGGGQSAQKGGAMPMGHDMGQMSPEMKTKCQMMMQAQLTPSDPSALVALKDQLKLTEDQVKKLQAIQEQARKDAAAVLNDEQKQQVAKIPATPDTSTGMHQQMMQMMKDMHGGQGGGRGCGPGFSSKPALPFPAQGTQGQSRIFPIPYLARHELRAHRKLLTRSRPNLKI